MSLSASRLRARFSWLALLGFLCVLLVLISGIVQVGHTHASGEPDHSCALCVTAHNVIQVVALVTLLVSSLTVIHLAAEPTLDLPRRAFFFKLSCRPPPAVSAFA